MELVLGQVAAAVDAEEGEQGGVRIREEQVGLVQVVVLQVDVALEGHSRVRLHSPTTTSTMAKVSSHSLV